MPGVNAPSRAFQPGIGSSADFTDSHRFFCVCIGVGFVFRLLESAHRGMHLTPETPTYSMRGCGGLPADAGGV